MMDDDYQIAQQLQAEEQEQLKQEKRGTNLSKELKGFKFEVIKDMFDKAFKRVNTFLDYKTELVKGSEKRAKDSTKRAGTELEQEVAKKQLKGFKFEVIKDMFDKAFKRVNTFLDYKIELVKGSEKREKDSTKRAGTELEQEVVKKQEIDDAKVDDDQEEERMKELMNIVPNEEEVAIDAISLATKPLCIVD
ncbi:hypothetical protein Tco_1436286 [Tanacetum coccineum]